MTYSKSNAFAVLVVAGWAIPLLIILFALAPPLAFGLIGLVVWNERRHYRKVQSARAERIRQFGIDPYTL